MAKVTNSALPSAPPLRGVSTTDESAVTPVRVRTPVVLKLRKVRLATQTVDATTHDEPLALRRSRRTTAGRKLDSILEAENEPLPQPEPEPAGSELEDEDNADGTEDVQNTKRINRSCSSPPTFPVTAVPVGKANTLIPPNQANRAKDRGEDLILCICGATEDNGGNWLQCDSCHKWLHMECHNLSEGAAKDMKFKCHICEPRNSRGCFAAPPLLVHRGPVLPQVLWTTACNL